MEGRTEAFKSKLQSWRERAGWREPKRRGELRALDQPGAKSELGRGAGSSLSEMNWIGRSARRANSEEAGGLDRLERNRSWDEELGAV